MKTIKKYFIAALILSFHISIYGQFNTLTPTQSKQANNPKIVEQIKAISKNPTQVPLFFEMDRWRLTEKIGEALE